MSGSAKRDCSRGLHALGYSEGQNIAVEFRYTEGRSDRAAEYAEELVRLGTDVIVAHFTLLGGSVLAWPLAARAKPLATVTDS